MSPSDDVTGSNAYRDGNGQRTPETAVVPSRCSTTGEPFVNHFERRSGAWAAVDTTVPESNGNGGGQSQTQTIEGSFEFPPEYPGCPHCSNSGLFGCGACDGLACWNVGTSTVVCPHCDTEITLDGDFERMESQGEVDGGSDPGLDSREEPAGLGRRE